MNKTFSKYYKDYYDKASGLPQQLDLKEIIFFGSVINHNQNYSILDLGCAEGELSIYLAEKGHSVTAADISNKQLDRVIKKSNDKNLNIDVINVDIQNDIAPFYQKKYDYIFMLDVIEHLMNPVKSLENIRLLLKETGKLIIHTPNSCSTYKYLRYFLCPHKKQNFYNLNKLGNLHLQSYDYLTIEQTLNFVGLKVEKIIPTKLSLPILNRFNILNGLFILFSKIFPLLSDTMLLVCNKTDPIDINQLIDYWEQK